MKIVQIFVRKMRRNASVYEVLVLPLLFVLLESLVTAASAQTLRLHSTPPERGKAEFTRLGIEEGLSLGSVNCVMQDRYGFIWVGTQDGLNRYDGYTFTVYRRTGSKDSTMIQELWISSILEDKSGTLWVAGGRGLHKFNRATNSFQRIPLHLKFATKSRAFINRLREDSAGNIWICTNSEGLVCYNPKTGSVERHLLPIPTSNPRRPLDIEVFVDDIMENTDGTFWLACANDGLYKFFPQELHPDKRFQQVHLRNLTSVQEHATRLTRDASGMMWMGTTNGVVRWNASTLTAEDVYLFDPTQVEQAVQRDYFHIEQSSSSLIRDIVHSRNGTTWIGTANGLFSLDPSRKHLTQYLNSPFDQTSLIGNMAFSICEDASGVLWIGDYSYGLSKFPQAQQRFTTYRNNPLDPTSLSNNYVRGIYEDTRGSIWVGTQYGGLNVLNRNDGTWKHYRANPQDSRALPTDNIWAITESRTGGELWIGMSGRGLCRFNSQTQVFTRFTGLTTQDESIWCLLRDNSDNIWAGGTNLYKIASNGRMLKTFHFSRTLTTQTIFQDRHDIIWVGRDDGLWKIMANDSLIAVPLPENNVVVTMISEDSRGNLWITSKGDGVFVLNTARNLIQRLTTADGLPHQNVYAALEDANGEMWFSSDNGLARYNLATKKFRLYGTGDGLQSQEFNRRAFATTSRGEMIFGGINGLNLFHPPSLRDNITPPPVALTSLSVRGRLIAGASELLGMQEIRLPHTDNFLQLSFAALEYSNPALNKYSYKLDGLDEEWINLGSKHEATYTNLSPGTYTFAVRAANADGYWNNEGRSLRIVILPPWWQTAWAYTLYVLATLGSMSGIILFVSKRQKQEFMRLQSEREAVLLHSKNEELLSANAQLQMLNMEKNEILGIVSHDLKNPISGIRGLAELMRQGFVEAEQIRIVSGQIVETSDRMFDLVRNLLDINQLESGDIQFQEIEFDISMTVNFTVDTFAVAAANKNIQIFTDIEPVSHVVIADERAMMQVVENIISNAVKYSPLGKNVYVRLFNQESITDGSTNVRLEVRDEGPGLSASDMEKLFGKFIRLSARPTGGEHSTGLGLSIVKRLVEGMKGKVWCESELGCGATFILTFPRVQEKAEHNKSVRLLPSAPPFPTDFVASSENNQEKLPLK